MECWSLFGVRTLVVVCICSTWLSITRAEYFSAISEISRASDLAQQLAADLNAFVEVEEERLNRIRQVATRLSAGDRPQDTSETDTLVDGNGSGAEEVLGNPINAYLTVKRLTLDWKSDLLSLLNGETANASDASSTVVDKAKQLRARVEQEAAQLPGHSDLDGAAEALLRLQATYRLNAEDIAHGQLNSDLACPKLSAAQCMHLGQKAYDQDDFERAEEWFRVAYNRLWEDEADVDAPPTDEDESWEKKPRPAEILDHLAYALGRQGRYAEALNVTRLLLQMEPGHQRSSENAAFYQNRIDHGEGIVGTRPRPKASSALEQETETYQALCRGEVLFPPPPTGSVYCRYYVPHPYYKIGPVKEEVLYPDPRIVMWYDVIHPSEIERIQQLAMPRLRRATVKNPVTGRLEFAFYRTSQSAWLPDDLDEITHRMNQRIHALTGLSMETAEDLQVGNYGIGGYYAPHFDFGRKREKDAFEIENGNRIATIIFYLTEVKAGGATVFNRFGAKVNPVRGAAGFWYNLHPSGEGDLRTRHVACPVLHGSKWVMNVWFHERGQEFRRPCGLTPDPVEVDDGF